MVSLVRAFYWRWRQLRCPGFHPVVDSNRCGYCGLVRSLHRLKLR